MKTDRVNSTLTMPRSPEEERDAAPVEAYFRQQSASDTPVVPHPSLLDAPLIYREIVDGVEQTVRIRLGDATPAHLERAADYHRQIAAYHRRQVES